MMKRYIIFSLFLFLLSSCSLIVDMKEPSNACGNGVRDSDEECDGDDLNWKTCENLGLPIGSLKCDDSCHFDTSLCIENSQNCGNGIIEGDEACDGSNLDGKTCNDLGYADGTLQCTSDCQVDTGLCTEFIDNCGNGIVDSGEACDGSNLDGKTCNDLGYTDGTLQCNANCQIDTGSCTGFIDNCGNGMIDPDEECDGTNLDNQTCTNLGFYSGTLQCTFDCNFDISDCEASGFCGDGIVQTSFGEACDGTDFSSDNCIDYGDFQPDSIDACNSNCQTDTSVCKRKWLFISLGDYHACGLKTDGSLYCWGQNSFGQLGIGNTNHTNMPEQVGDATNWATVSAGDGHTCGVKNDGSLYCWGNNSFGQLGIGNTNHTNIPMQVGNATNWATVSAGSNYTCGLKTDGFLFCWGNNGDGQLGIGNTNNTNIPVQVEDTPVWVKVTAGKNYRYSHTCGLKIDGSLHCWGNNDLGQLGLGTPNTDPDPDPEVVGDATDWTSIVSDSSYTCGIKMSNTLYCWGGNSVGQLGLGTYDSDAHSDPEQVGSDVDWATVSTGWTHACGLKTDGTLYCWGSNSFGQLGLGTSGTNQVTPQLVGTATDWLLISAGLSFTCGVKTDGSLYCWGSNSFGQLGLGNTPDQCSPTRLPL